MYESFQGAEGISCISTIAQPIQAWRRAFLYAISLTVASLALIQEEDRMQLPMYYTSRALKGAKERYPPMEKLAFALITAVPKLKPYF